MGKCQAAVAEAVEAFGRVDILFCCTSEGRFPHYFSEYQLPSTRFGKACTDYW